MASTIDQARLTFSKMFNGERYSRFTLQPEGDGESHVEVKLSDDVADDHVPSELVGQSQGSPSYRLRPQHNYRSVCYLALGTLLIFLIGYMIGYVSHPSDVSHPSPVLEQDEGESIVLDTEPEPSLDWSEIVSLLEQKLTSDTFKNALRDTHIEDHTAGSEGDNLLGKQVFATFKTLEMKPWTDIHYVQLQTQDSKLPNRVLIGSDEVVQPKGYLAYSTTGKAQGRVVYSNYGRQEDLNVLQTKKIDLNGSVVLLRAGIISFAEKVANAAGLGASAVLIYPDPADYKFNSDTELYGHVHLGTGDPYTPGFPSFNHTQFPPTKSSGLPSILAQTITADTAAKILMMMEEGDAPENFKGNLKLAYKLGAVRNVTVEVNNVLVDKEIHNVFGVIKGFTDPDQYVVLGAQRDSWGPGMARATVGTTLLQELARAVSEMVEKDGFRPGRSLVFASWSAGEYGSVGATEWLEGYLASMDKKAFTYINLDGVVTGHGAFRASACPLLQTLLENTMKQVKSPIGFGKSRDTLLQAAGPNWLEPMQMEESAYPFLAFAGIPSLSFRFISPESKDYPYYGTSLDNMDHINVATGQNLFNLVAGAGQLAGQLALRLVHNHILPLDVQRYKSTIIQSVFQIKRHLRQPEVDSEGLTANWLIKAYGSYTRAADSLINAIDTTDYNNKEACRILNSRIMGVEHNLLSLYVSPKDMPFRHLIFGRGSHTLAAISASSDREQLHTQLALATWTLQGCANALAGDIWDLDNDI